MAEPIVTEPSLPAELPVVPLRRAVVFPMTVQPLAVNRPVSVDSINRALAADRMVLLVMQQGEDDDPPAEALRRIGTVAVIRQMAKSPVGLQILVEGLARVRVVEYTREQATFRARIQAAPEAVERSLEVDAYVRRVRELIDRAVSLSTGLSPELRGLLLSIDDPLRLCYLLASLLDMKRRTSSCCSSRT
jgi:ATP-dependent Lon protease